MGAAAAPLAIVGAGAQLGGTFAQVQGLRAAGAAARQRADYQAAILRNNALISRRAAADAIARGRVTEARKRTAIAQMTGSQRTALAASGILVDEGSAADIVADTAFVGEQEINDIRTNAERQSLAQQIEAMNFEADANLVRLTGEQQARALRRQIAPTILSGIGNVAGSGAAFLKG